MSHLSFKFELISAVLITLMAVISSAYTEAKSSQQTQNNNEA